MNLVLNALDSFRAKHDLAGLVVVHHDRKKIAGTITRAEDMERIRGSSALLAWPESLALLTMTDIKTGKRQIYINCRDYTTLPGVELEYDPETMISEGRAISPTRSTAQLILNILEEGGGRLRNQLLFARIKEGRDIAERTYNDAKHKLTKEGKIYTEPTKEPGAHHREKDVVLVQEEEEIAF